MVDEESTELETEILNEIGNDPFSSHFDEMISSAMLKVRQAPDNFENDFYSPDLFESFKRNFIHRIPLFSGCYRVTCRALGSVPNTLIMGISTATFNQANSKI